MKRTVLILAGLALISARPIAQTSSSAKFDAIAALAEYPYLPGVRADLLFKLKRFDEAKVEFLRAADLTRNVSQRALLLQKAADC